MSDYTNRKQTDCLTDNQNDDEEIVRLLFNKVYVVNINKKKLIKKSLYFRVALKTTWEEGHLLRFLEVNFETSRSIFKQVARYIEKGSFNFSKHDLFEVYKLAVYLGMAGLQQLCLDHFAFNLTSGNVENRLRSLQRHNFIVDDFKEVALRFKRSGVPSYSGFYFLAVENRKSRKQHLKLYCERTNSLYDVKLDIPEKESYEMESFSTILAVSYPEKYPKNENSLLLYDIVSGEVNQISTVANDEVSENEEDFNQTMICSGNDRLFVVSVTEKRWVSSWLSLSVYEKVSGKVALSASENFHQPFEGKFPIFGKIYLLFAHFAENQVFVFYCEDKFEKEQYKQIEITNELYIMTICVQTLSVVKNKKVLIENPTLDKMFLDTEIFRYHLYDKKEQKMLINIGYASPSHSPSRLSFDYTYLPTLVFDLKKHRFYLKDQSVRWALTDHFGFSSSRNPYKAMLKGNVLYAFYPISREQNDRHGYRGVLNIATFCFEDGKTSGGKTVFNSEDQEIIFDEDLFVWSVCFV